MSRFNKHLRQGDRVPQVVWLQRMLRALGYIPGEEDGHFGPWTRQAVISFQMDHELFGTGVVDERTLECLKIVYDARQRLPGTVSPGHIAR